MGGELAEAPALGPHPRSLPGVLVMDEGTKQDGDAKLGLGGRGRGGGGRGGMPLPLVSSPNREQTHTLCITRRILNYWTTGTAGKNGF